jgi:vancomycin resistance protein YoaR
MTVLSPPAQARQPRPRRWVFATVNLLLLLAFAGGTALLYRRSLRTPRTVPGIVLGDHFRLDALGPSELDGAIAAAATRLGEQHLKLLVGNSAPLWIRRSELGARVNVAETRARLLATGRTGDFLRDLVDRIRARRGKLRVPLSVEVERDQALEFFTRLKQSVDRAPVPARLDLDRGKLVPGIEGYQLHVYDCLAATELALAREQPEVRLAVTVTPPAGGERLKGLVIDKVLGSFTTVYSLADKDADRAFNLKVGASKLDGTVLEPGARFSFNETVGPRTEAEGYRTAPVITEGELVDGMAGGACQLSSTLFAAAFFAGLELVSSRPHTRPSSYIKMGLDAAVAYPGTDLVLKNPYPFPVVIHFKVSQGKVQVRLLGKQRPWRKVVFEREVKETVAFKTETRQAAHIPRGVRVISQVGVPGFKIERRRLFFGGGKDPEKVEKREVNYPPTTQYVLEGTGPRNPDWKPPPELKPFGEVPPQFSLAQ